jgi:hypothetical protein
MRLLRSCKLSVCVCARADHGLFLNLLDYLLGLKNVTQELSKPLKSWKIRDRVDLCCPCET